MFGKSEGGVLLAFDSYVDCFTGTRISVNNKMDQNLHFRL